MLRDLLIERFRCRVVSEPEELAASDAGQPSRAGDQQEPERAHAAEQVRVGPFAGPRLRFGHRVQLEAPDQVVGEDAELLPRAVGGVMLGRHHVEGELTLILPFSAVQIRRDS